MTEQQHIDVDLTEGRIEVTDETVEAVARALWPFLWDRDAFERQLAKLSIFTPEQAAESAERKRQEKRDLVRRVLVAYLTHESNDREQER